MRKQLQGGQTACNLHRLIYAAELCTVNADVSMYEYRLSAFVLAKILSEETNSMIYYT